MRYLKNKAGGGRNMLQLNYKLTDEDYIEFNEFHQLIHSEVGKRNLFFLKLAGPMISVLAIVIFILARAEKMLIITEVIVLCIFSIVCVAQAKIMKRGIRKTILKMIETEGLPFAEEITLTFTEDQIIEITKGQEVKVDYQKVENVCETETAFYIYISSIEALIIPKRVLNQDMEKKLIRIVTENFAHLISINK